MKRKDAIVENLDVFSFIASAIRKEFIVKITVIARTAKTIITWK